jgi:hypothetical protein
MTYNNTQLEIKAAWEKSWKDKYPGEETSKSAHIKGFEDGYMAATATYNPYTGCKCKLYESERSLALEEKVKKLQESNNYLTRKLADACILIADAYQPDIKVIENEN